MGLINIEDLSDLTAYSVSISKMDEIKTCQSDSVFVASRSIGVDQYSSIKFDFDTLSTQIVCNTLSSSLQFINSNWFFAKDVKMPISEIQKHILSNSNSKVAINVETMNLCCIQHIYDLSNEIYQKQHMPSHVGQIIFSDNLSSEDAVKKIYGENTKWKRYVNRFIMGTGIREPNTINTSEIITGHEWDAPSCLGGHSNGTVTITSAMLPEHDHKKIQANPQNFTLRYLFGQDPVRADEDREHINENPIARKHDYKLKGAWTGGASPQWNCLGTSNSTDADAGATDIQPSYKYKGDAKLNTEIFVEKCRKNGTPVSIGTEIYTPSYKIRNTQTPFNHMPLFRYAYVWRRES